MVSFLGEKGPYANFHGSLSGVEGSSCSVQVPWQVVEDVDKDLEARICPNTGGLEALGTGSSGGGCESSSLSFNLAASTMSWKQTFGGLLLWLLVVRFWKSLNFNSLLCSLLPADDLDRPSLALKLDISALASVSFLALLVHREINLF